MSFRVSFSPSSCNIEHVLMLCLSPNCPWLSPHLYHGFPITFPSLSWSWKLNLGFFGQSPESHICSCQPLSKVCNLFYSLVTLHVRIQSKWVRNAKKLSACLQTSLCQCGCCQPYLLPGSLQLRAIHSHGKPMLQISHPLFLSLALQPSPTPGDRVNIPWNFKPWLSSCHFRLLLPRHQQARELTWSVTDPLLMYNGAAEEWVWHSRDHRASLDTSPPNLDRKWPRPEPTPWKEHDD